MKQPIEFMTIDGIVAVGFKCEFGYVAINGFENEQCGIWEEYKILYVLPLTRSIFYKSGDEIAHND